MEFFYFVVILVVLVALVNFFKEEVTYKSPEPKKSSKNVQIISSRLKNTGTQAKTGELLDRENEREIREMPRQEVHHVHHVHVRHEWASENSNKEDEDKDHTSAVWERLGYQVKAGETYSYKFYGREIFKSHQVVKAGCYRKRIASTSLSEKQIKVKTLGLALVEKTGSKRKAKDILVDEYGFSENTAKYAAGYRGYDDY